MKNIGTDRTSFMDFNGGDNTDLLKHSNRRDRNISLSLPVLLLV